PGNGNGGDGDVETAVDGLVILEHEHLHKVIAVERYNGREANEVDAHLARPGFDAARIFPVVIVRHGILDSAMAAGCQTMMSMVCRFRNARKFRSCLTGSMKEGDVKFPSRLAASRRRHARPLGLPARRPRRPRLRRQPGRLFSHAGRYAFRGTALRSNRPPD